MSRLWSIVLAAGEGRRLASVTGGIPKQFWSPSGDRSLLEQTILRLAPLTPHTRIVTVIDQSQRALAEALSSSTSIGRLLDQPLDRGTAAGVLLGLSAVRRLDRDAVVVIAPSDHGVERPSLFVNGIRFVESAVIHGQADIVLFGVTATSAVGEYGWISAVPAGASSGLQRVIGFVEKPPVSDAEELLATGAVWSTMVLVARAEALWGLYAVHLPWLTDLFHEADQLGEVGRRRFLTSAYRDLPRSDFSHDLLRPARGLALFTWPASLGWTDLGTPSRLAAWLQDRQRPSQRPPVFAAAAHRVA